MDGLMSEAADLILCSNRQVGKDPSNGLMLESRRNSTSAIDISSVSLLRRSITTSIRERRTQSDVLDIETSNQNKIRRRKGSASVRKPKVSINQLSTDEGDLRVDVCTTNGNQNRDSEEQSKPAEEESAETQNDKMCLSPAEKRGPKSKAIAENENNDVREIRGEAKSRKIAENGLKLARRNFSDNIFENCSTYSLTCPEVIQKRNGTVATKRNSHAEDTWFCESTDISTDKSVDVDSRKDPDYKKNIGRDNLADDQISLSDSFFVSVVSGDSSSQNSFTSKVEDEYSSGIKRLSRVSFSRENDPSVSEDVIRDNDRLYFRKSERRLSKKLRKKLKKVKSKDVSTYECPKCGVSYILSAKTSESTARCLHCDFWISVEPVFLRRGKQPWNTCRVC